MISCFVFPFFSLRYDSTMHFTISLPMAGGWDDNRCSDFWLDCSPGLWASLSTRQSFHPGPNYPFYVDAFLV